MAAWNLVGKPLKEAWEKIDEVRTKIPNLALNEKAKKEELGITGESLKAAYDENDITKAVNSFQMLAYATLRYKLPTANLTRVLGIRSLWSG